MGLIIAGICVAIAVGLAGTCLDLCDVTQEPVIFYVVGFLGGAVSMLLIALGSLQ